MKAHRISIGPGEVAGYFSRLKTGFDTLGAESEHFVLSANKFDYPESDYFLRNVFLKVSKFRDSRSSIVRLLGKLSCFGVRTFVFMYAFIRFDVFIFSGFNSFFWFYELPLLKLFGKRVLVIYLGSDARPPIFSGRHLDDAGEFVHPKHAYREAVRMINKIKRVEKYADLIINHTATSQFFSRNFARLNAIGMPACDASKNLEHIEIPNDGTVHILHAPTRPLAKGSLLFRQVIEELRTEGYLISFVELMGVPNRVVLEELQRCDFVLDELYSDVPLAMLATEAAMFGKPVVVGGYYAEQYKIDNPDTDLPPSLYVEPENIKEAIKKLIDDQEYRLNLGRQAKDFVQKKWSPWKVAENYLRLVEGSYSENWMCSPITLSYFRGWGLSKENWQKQVNRYVSFMGEDALFLDHNPKLRQMVMAEVQQSKVERTA